MEQQYVTNLAVAPGRSSSINTSVTGMLHLLHLLTSIWKIPGPCYLSEGIINLSLGLTWTT